MRPLSPPSRSVRRRAVTPPTGALAPESPSVHSRAAGDSPPATTVSTAVNVT
jgi:hypothetical protein